VRCGVQVEQQAITRDILRSSDCRPAATPASRTSGISAHAGAVDLADVDVALRVDAQRVRPVKGARLPAACAEASQFGEVVTIEDVDREIRQSATYTQVSFGSRESAIEQTCRLSSAAHQNLANEAALAGVAVRVCARLATSAVLNTCTRLLPRSAT